MELWIRSTAKTNLLKVRFLTILNGDNFYEKDEWEYDGYTICNCTENGNYELLGTYKTKERALEVLDEIQNMIKPTLINTEYHSEIKQGVDKLSFDVVMTPTEDKITYIQPNVVVYEMPKE